MQELFIEQINRYHLRKNRCWQVPKVKTVAYGLETVRYRGPKTWEILPNHIKNSHNLADFKRKIKTWKPEGCTCRLCLIYIYHYGFI